MQRQDKAVSVDCVLNCEAHGSSERKIVTYDLRFDRVVGFEATSGASDVFSWRLLNGVLQMHGSRQQSNQHDKPIRPSCQQNLQSSKTGSSSEYPHPHVEGLCECGAATNATEDPPVMR